MMKLVLIYFCFFILNQAQKTTNFIVLGDFGDLGDVGKAKQDYLTQVTESMDYTAQ
jgi:hypothetical protein